MFPQPSHVTDGGTRFVLYIFCRHEFEHVTRLRRLSGSMCNCCPHTSHTTNGCRVAFTSIHAIVLPSADSGRCPDSAHLMHMGWRVHHARRLRAARRPTSASTIGASSARLPHSGHSPICVPIPVTLRLVEQVCQSAGRTRGRGAIVQNPELPSTPRARGRGASIFRDLQIAKHHPAHVSVAGRSSGSKPEWGR